MSDFNQVIDKILEAEGGYVNDPNDPGGETKYGISKRQYPDLDIANLTIEQAKAIYKRDYWDKVKGDEIHYPLSLFVFDCAVNQGVDTAIRLLQKTVNIAQDGIFGIGTMKAVMRAGKSANTDFMAYRAMRYMGTRNFDIYGKGWLKRLFKITAES